MGTLIAFYQRKVKKISRRFFIVFLSHFKPHSSSLNDPISLERKIKILSKSNREMNATFFLVFSGLIAMAASLPARRKDLTKLEPYKENTTDMRGEQMGQGNMSKLSRLSKTTTERMRQGNAACWAFCWMLLPTCTKCNRKYN